MTTSEQIRKLASEGFTVSEIASRLGIRYQHAFNVVRGAGAHQGRVITAGTKLTVVGATRMRSVAASPLPEKPELSVARLLEAGFERAGQWMISATDELKIDGLVPPSAGVYVFARDGLALYAGVATMGLRRRLYFYAHPGRSQITNLRLHSAIRQELENFHSIDVYTISIGESDWRGLPIDHNAGLEFGLIKHYSLPWNIRSATLRARGVILT